MISIEQILETFQYASSIEIFGISLLSYFSVSIYLFLCIANEKYF